MKKKFNNKKELEDELMQLEQKEQIWMQNFANWKRSVRSHARLLEKAFYLVCKNKKSGNGIFSDILSRALWFFKNKS